MDAALYELFIHLLQTRETLKEQDSGHSYKHVRSSCEEWFAKVTNSDKDRAGGSAPIEHIAPVHGVALMYSCAELHCADIAGNDCSGAH